MCGPCVTGITHPCRSRQRRRRGLSGYRWLVRRVRADSLLAERGLVASRSAAAASIRAGLVRIGEDGPAVDKPSAMIEPTADLRLAEPQRFVSRGGLKLDNALEEFGLDVSGLDCLDVGASTGGFTDCLLSRGAARVIALDVGHGQLDWGLRGDERVTVMERTNARALGPGVLPYEPTLVVADVSFISLAKLIEPIASAMAPAAELLAMVKPQFELGPEKVGKGGVVRDAADRQAAVDSVAAAAEAAGLSVHGTASSGLPGPKGNLETFVWARRG
jgi:23S rRNA (cytidine1920-2'-O)/16S rRNA (cytidine1409-2'-O)-methyltransferase